MRVAHVLLIGLALLGCGAPPRSQTSERVERPRECRGVVDARSAREVLAAAMPDALDGLPAWCARPRYRFGARLRVGPDGRVEGTDFGGCAMEVSMLRECPHPIDSVAQLRFPPPSPRGECAWVDVPATVEAEP
jgi:hypothetical protein